MKEIDLGLSVKWSSCNLGANRPEEYGGYYQWGGIEDVSKLNYLPEAPYRNPNILDPFGWIKYNTKNSYGIVDNKTTLDLSDDVANVTLGDSWHVPTDDELSELREDCTWTWTTINNINGYKVTSKKRGYTDNSIFLPAAGYRGDTGLGSFGAYLSSSLNINSPINVWIVSFESGDVYRSYDYRCFGQSVRPVHE